MAKTDDKRKAIGAMWKQKTKDGKVYFTGNMDDMDIVIFKNGYKDEQKAGAPDFLVYKSVPLEGTNKTQTTTEDDDF